MAIAFSGSPGVFAENNLTNEQLSDSFDIGSSPEVIHLYVWQQDRDGTPTNNPLSVTVGGQTAVQLGAKMEGDDGKLTMLRYTIDNPTVSGTVTVLVTYPAGTDALNDSWGFSVAAFTGTSGYGVQDFDEAPGSQTFHFVDIDPAKEAESILLSVDISYGTDTAPITADPPATQITNGTTPGGGSGGGHAYCMLWDKNQSQLSCTATVGDGFLMASTEVKESSGPPPSGRIMSSLVGPGGLVARGGIAGPGGGLAG